MQTPISKYPGPKPKFLEAQLQQVKGWPNVKVVQNGPAV